MEEAPDENREFCILERYRYLTKVRCYLSAGEYLKAQTLLEKLRYYAEKCRRTYVRIRQGGCGTCGKEFRDFVEGDHIWKNS